MRHLAALAAALVLSSQAAAAGDADIVVNVRKEGDAVHVAVDCPVRAPPAVAWDVMTDYDNMSKFISNLTESAVRMRMGNRLQVCQKGKASRGPLSISFQNMREIELVPKTEIRSKMIAGDNDAGRVRHPHRGARRRHARHARGQVHAVDVGAAGDRPRRSSRPRRASNTARFAPRS